MARKQPMQQPSVNTGFKIGKGVFVMSDDELLKHYGTKGMKWRKQSQHSPDINFHKAAAERRIEQNLALKKLSESGSAVKPLGIEKKKTKKAVKLTKKARREKTLERIEKTKLLLISKATRQRSRDRQSVD